MSLTSEEVLRMTQPAMINVIKTGKVHEKILVCQAPNVTPRVLELAMKDISTTVATTAAANINANDKVLDIAIRSRSDAVVKAALMNTAITPEILKKAYGITTKAILKQEILFNPKAPKIVFDWAIKEHGYIKAQAALSPFIPFNLLQKLSTDSEPSTRLNVLLNEQTTLLMLIKATKDLNSSVSKAAAAAILKRKKSARIKD